MMSLQREVFSHMGYEAVIYDLDGTLLNTLDDLTAAVNHTMRAFGCPEHSAENVRHMIGNGLAMLVRRALPENASFFEEALAVYKAYYAQHANDLTRAYDGVEDLLEALFRAGVPQAIVSNKGDSFVQTLHQRYFSRWITLAVGERETVRAKPHPDSVLAVIDAWQCDPAKVLYVGDSEVDIQTARNAGVDCASVCWGFRTEEELRASGATLLVHNPQELLPIILGSFPQKNDLL